MLLQAVGGRVKNFKIYRWDPDAPGSKPTMVTYPIKLDE
jgi:hypothetical protein